VTRSREIRDLKLLSNLSSPRTKILPAQPLALEVGIPTTGYIAQKCKKFFSKILSLIDYEESEILCPSWGSKNVEKAYERRRPMFTRVVGITTKSGKANELANTIQKRYR